MDFRATNYSVAILLVMAATVAMIIVRSKKPLENNWPLFYWIFVAIVALRWPGDTWDFRIVGIGAAAGLMLRFEFMNDFFVKIVRVIEFGIQAYLLYASMLLVFY